MTKAFAEKIEVKKIFLNILVLLIAAVSTSAQNETATLFRQPTVNRTDVVFSYAGDLWIVPKSGGDAKRLTTGIGMERDPYFSPDGATIAFTGEYDGNTDVFTIPATGGVPKRLTYHPALDKVSGWTPDGRSVMFSSTRHASANFSRLYTFPVDGSGLPIEIPLPMANRGWLSPDGQFVAYEPLSQWQEDWKRYKGGQTQPIWIAVFPIRQSNECRAKTRTTNARCGLAIKFIFSRTGTAARFRFCFRYEIETSRTGQLIIKDSI
jgi:tricorn protease